MSMHDHPINGKEEDELGVSRFAENLAQKLLDSKTRISSTAIGIVAPWGYGKTSILNLMKAELNKNRDKNKLLIFDFNPWIYSKRSNLTSEYINTLENEISPMKKEWGKITKAITEFHKVLTVLVGKEIISKVPFLETLKNLISLKSEAKTHKNLEDCKKAINQSLEGKQIIVFIDDIDRLPADEVMDILRMVKSICNFKNCVYVLAYDEEYIIKAIKEAFGEKGDDYLEKIISLPYKLPEYSNEIRIKFLKKGLQKDLVEPAHYQQLIETEYCQALLETLVSLYLQTPRRINRLLNAFRTSYMIAGTTLHWGDLLAIEALRLYSKKTYETISKNKEHYLATIGNEQTHRFNKNKPANRDTSIEDTRLSLVSELSDPKDQNQKLIDLLFPLFRTNLYNNQTLENADKERRVSSQHFFGNYFHIELNNTVLTEKEIQQLIAVLDTNPERFSEQLTAYTEENGILLTSTLTTLIDRVSKMEHTKQETLLEWCFNSLDEYTDNKQHIKNHWFFEHLFENFLKSPKNSLPDLSGKKKGQFYEWLCRIQNIEILASFIQPITEKKSISMLHSFVFTEEQIAYLKTIAIKQFKTLIQSENYFQSAHPIPRHFLTISEAWKTPTDEKPYKRQWFEKAKAYPGVLSQFAYPFIICLGYGEESAVRPSLKNLLDWGIEREEVMAFLPSVIEYCQNNVPEKVPFMEKFLEDVKGLSTD
jgi:predicted KAP-like P-loop ATPase